MYYCNDPALPKHLLANFGCDLLVMMRLSAAHSEVIVWITISARLNTNLLLSSSELLVDAMLLRRRLRKTERKGGARGDVESRLVLRFLSGGMRDKPPISELFGIALWPFAMPMVA